MKIVGITSCTVGIAQTYMAADAIEKFFKGLGHEIKIERNGCVGAENELTSEDIENADVIILACTGDIYNRDRFVPYADKIVSISVEEALRKTHKVKELMEAKNLYKE
jgi:fructose-specific phosphotransferase system IIB component